MSSDLKTHLVHDIIMDAGAVPFFHKCSRYQYDTLPRNDTTYGKAAIRRQTGAPKGPFHGFPLGMPVRVGRIWEVGAQEGLSSGTLALSDFYSNLYQIFSRYGQAAVCPSGDGGGRGPAGEGFPAGFRRRTRRQWLR